MKRIKIQIDEAHTVQIVSGRAIAIKVPKGADVIELKLSPAVVQDSFAKLVDVFFNGRKA
jgi:hypothetical protein